MGEWLIFEHDEIHDERGVLRCPVEGCGATGPDRIELIGHEYNLMPGGGETWVFECDRGHEWDLEPWADDSNLVRVWVHEGVGRTTAMDEAKERAERSYSVGRFDAMNGDRIYTREEILSDPNLDLDPDEYERGHKSYQEEE